MARRRGVGRLLVKEAEERFASLGGRRADTMVLDENCPAHLAWAALKRISA